jgi:nucleoside-diphosphate-sugar epimerase
LHVDSKSDKKAVWKSKRGIVALHLITGGSGFVGSTIARLLDARGEKTRVLDLWKADDLPVATEFIQADITDEAAVARAMQGVDYVHHNVALVPLTKADTRFEAVNAVGTQIALRCAAKAGVKFFSHMSSSAIFGAPDKMPITNATPLRPIEIYGATKKKADDYARETNEQGLIKTACIRPRTIIGKTRMGIFEILFDWIKDNAHIYVIGSGDHLFQFVHAEDLAEVSIQAALQEKPGLYNVGTDRFGTLRQDLGWLIAQVGSRSKIRSLPVGPTVTTLRILDKMNLSPLSPWHYMTYHKVFYFDSMPVTQALGWKPRYSNQEMLLEAYQWFLANYERERTAPHGASIHKSPVKQGVLKLVKMLSRAA